MKSYPNPLDVSNCLTTLQAGNISAAARLLGITQSALSQSINKLERDLGIQILVRERTGTVLTPQGKRILPELRQYLAAGSQISEKIHSESQSYSGRFTLGCHASVGVYALPKIFKQLQKSAPEIQLSLTHMNSREIQEAVIRGDLDLGLVINPAPIQDLVIKKMGTDTFKVWRHKSLKTESIVLFCDPDLVQTQTLIKRLKIAQLQVCHTRSLEVIRALVFAGAGLGIAPERVMSPTREIEQVPGSPMYKDQLALVFRPALLKLAAAQVLIKWILN